MRIGVIGGTGPAGTAVAVQLAAIGEAVVIGSRSEPRAAEAARALRARWPGRTLDIEGSDNAGAADVDIVVIATPWDATLQTVAELAAQLEGKLVVSMVNAMTRLGKALAPLLVPTGSVTAAVALALPGSRVVGAFHHLPADQWSDLDGGVSADVLVCAERRADAREVVGLVDRLPGLRGIDAGGLANAVGIEALTATLVGINVRYKSHAALRLTGVEK